MKLAHDRGVRGRDVLPPLRRGEGRRRRRRPRSPCACARRFSCEMAGGDALRARACGLRERGVRVLAAPCIGRCEQAPAAVVGRNPVDEATAAQDRRRDRRTAASSPSSPPYLDYAAYRAARRLRARCASASTASARRSRDRRDGELGAARPGRRGLSRRAASGRSCAREPAPRLMAVNIDEGEPGTFKDRYYLERDPHRFLEGMLIAAWAVGIDADLHLPARRVRGVPRDARRASSPRSRADPPCALPRDPPAARRRRVHLRRRVGDDRIDRRQARHAAPAPAVRRAGRPVRPAHARAQHGDAVLGARHPREGRRVVRRARAATAARACARSRCRAA